TPTSRRTFFESHIRTVVLDRLARSVPRLDALHALRALTTGELKRSPRTLADIAEHEKLTTAAAEHALDLAAAPTARIVVTDEEAGAERFALVHDLFAGAIHSLVAQEDAARRRRSRNRVIGILALAFVVTAAFAITAAVQWRRSVREKRAADEQRQAVERERKRQTATRLAEDARARLDDDPRRALLLAASALTAADEDPLPIAESVIRDALA